MRYAERKRESERERKKVSGRFHYQNLHGYEWHNDVRQINISLENRKLNANSLNDIVVIVVEHFVMRSDGMFKSNHFATAPYAICV